MAQRKKKEEVRFHLMKPADIVKRRQVCSIAYLPVGAIEWHGPYLPFGTDFLTVENLSVQLAEKSGGIAFPPMCYSDIRYNLQEARPSWHEVYSQEMELDPALTSTFVITKKTAKHYHGKKSPGFLSLPMSKEEQIENFVKQVAYAIMSIRIYGFRAVVLLPGHGGIASYIDRAIEVFEENAKCTKRLQPLPILKNIFYINTAKEIEPRLKKHWIHADKWESSVMLAMAPETVHPEMLPKDKKTIPSSYLGEPYLHPKTGYSPKFKHLWENFDALDPRNMNLSYGKKHVHYIVKAIGKQIDEIKQQLKKEK